MAGAQPTARTNPAANADAMFTPDQGSFIAAMWAYTRLDKNVIAAWVLSENAAGGENGAQNWLGVGIETGGTRVGNTSSVWNSPVTAAEATAAWGTGDKYKLKQMGFTQFSVASPEIKKIFAAWNESAEQQIALIQYNGPGGWSTGGEPSLPSLYNQIVAAGGINLQDGTWSKNAAKYPASGSSGTVTPDFQVPNPLGVFSSVADFLSQWFSTAGLIRMAKIIAGMVLVFMSIKMLMNREGLSVPKVGV